MCIERYFSDAYTAALDTSDSLPIMKDDVSVNGTDQVQKLRETNLATALQDRKWRVRAKGMAALEKDAQNGMSSAAVRAAVQCVKHRSWRTRAAGLRALKTCSRLSKDCPDLAAAVADHVTNTAKACNTGSDERLVGATIRAVVFSSPGACANLQRIAGEDLACIVTRALVATVDAHAREVALDALAELGSCMGPTLKLDFHQLLSNALADDAASVRMAAVSSAVHLCASTGGRGQGRGSSNGVAPALEVQQCLRLLRRYLGDEEVLVRCEALHGLSVILQFLVQKCNIQTFAKLVLDKVSDSSVHVRRVAASLLRHSSIGHPNPFSSSPKELESLAAKSNDWWVWHHVLIALISSDDSLDCARHWHWLLMQKQREDQTGVAFRRLLAEIPTANCHHCNARFGPLNTTSAQASAERLEHSWWRSRQYAVLELSCFVAEGNKTLAWTVAALVGHAHVGTRCAALQVLANLRPGSNSEVVNWLVEALDDADQEVRRCAVHSLSCIARNGAICQETAEAVVNCLVLSGREAAKEATIAIAAASQGEKPLLTLDEPVEDLIANYLSKVIEAPSCELLVETLVETLGRAAPRGHSLSVSILSELLAQTNDPSLRFTVLKALAVVASPHDFDQHQMLYEAAKCCSTDCDAINERSCEVARDILERFERQGQINKMSFAVSESLD